MIQDVNPDQEASSNREYKEILTPVRRRKFLLGFKKLSNMVQ